MGPCKRHICNVFIVSCSLTFLSCTFFPFYPFFPEPSERIYTVVKIHTWSVEEYVKKFGANGIRPEIIHLVDYEPGGEFRGRVKLATIGWLPIRTPLNPLSRRNGFIVNLKVPIKGVEYVFFRLEEITISEMVGSYTLSGKTLDSAPTDFVAIQEYQLQNY